MDAGLMIMIFVIVVVVALLVVGIFVLRKLVNTVTAESKVKPETVRPEAKRVATVTHPSSAPLSSSSPTISSLATKYVTPETVSMPSFVGTESSQSWTVPSGVPMPATIPESIADLSSIVKSDPALAPVVNYATMFDPLQTVTNLITDPMSAIKYYQSPPVNFLNQ